MLVTLRDVFMKFVAIIFCLLFVACQSQTGIMPEGPDSDGLEGHREACEVNRIPSELCP